MTGEVFTIDRLVYEHWGGGPLEWSDVDHALRRIERREGWMRKQLGGPLASASYQVFEWHDRYGAGLGWSLHLLGITAVSTRRPEWGLPPEFHLTSEGRLFEALSADGAFTLPDADWLLAPLSPSDKAAIAASPVNGGWEAYNLKHWKPYTRAEALFTHWD